MKILIVGRKSNYNAEYFYEKAYRKLGHDVSILDSYIGVTHSFVRRYLHTRTNIINFTLHNYWINKYLKRIVNSYDPDIIIFFKGEFILSRLIAELSQNRNIYLFYPDTYKFKPLLRQSITYYRTVFTAANNTGFYEDMGAKKVVTIPWACDPDFHKVLDIEKKYDVSFVGTAYRERRKIIRKIKNVEVFGDFWFGFGKNAHKSVNGEGFIRTINQSLINLNLQTRVSVLADAPTMRTFEIAGCGGFQISDFMPSVKKYFPKIPTFNDTKELKELISYFLSNQSEAKEIAYKTMETCYSYYKYTDAAIRILSNV